MRAIAIISGGMDSAVAAAWAKSLGYEVIGVHFSYTQRTEEKERDSFRAVCEDLHIHVRYEIALPFFGVIGASALTDPAIEVPIAPSAEAIPTTYVPFRNGIFLSIAAAIAEKEGAQMLVIGAVEEDSSGYPDCREEFLRAIEHAIQQGSKHKTLQIFAPLLHLNKGQIVHKAGELGVNLAHTWSCYQETGAACGVCESCRLRLGGFNAAGASDPLPYQLG